MPQGKSKYLPLGALVTDLGLLLLSYFTVYYVLNREMPSIPKYYIEIAGAGLLWVSIALKRNLFDWPRILYLDKILYENFKATLVFISMSAALLFLIDDDRFSRLLFGSTMLIFLWFVSLFRIVMVLHIKSMRKEGLNYRNIIIVGDNEKTLKIYKDILSNKEHSYRIQGVFNGSTAPTNEFKAFYKGAIADVPDFCKQHTIDEMLVSLPNEKTTELNTLIEFAENNLIRISVIPEFSGKLNQFFNIQYVFNTPHFIHP